MALIFAENIIEVAVVMKASGRPHINVLHFHNDEVNGNDEGKVVDVRDNWQDHIMPFLSSEVTLETFEWRSLDPDDQNVGTVIPDPGKAVVGGAVGSMNPPNVTYLVHKNTANRPRGRRDGRMFISGVLEANSANYGAVEAAALTSINGALADFLSGVNDPGFGMNSGSYLAVLETTPESRVGGTTPVTLTHRPVTSLTLDPILATQRERLR